MTDQPPGDELTESRELRALLRELHDNGVIDLDAPLRNIVPSVEEAMGEVRRMREEAEGRAPGPNAAGYHLAGDRGFCSHSRT